MGLAVGSRLGPYEILVPLGAGGMGEVYRARDTRLERTVAIKVLPAHLSSSPDLRQRLEREAKAISSLNHPNICTLYDVGHQEGTDYLVMEFLEGESLAERIAKGPLPVEQVLKIGTEIAEALEKAHGSGVVHRDLKPGNVMLTKSGAKLLDFGLAKPSGVAAAGGSGSLLHAALTATSPVKPITQAGTVVGTFQYMSPEQVQGQEADARSDIFALGAVLYEMVTGKRAFEGKSAISVASAILEKEPEPISALQPMTPPALDQVVRGCLRKEPEERYQSAHDVKLQLKWIAEGGSQAGAPAVVVKHRRHREWVAWGAAALLLAAATILGAAALRRYLEQPQVVRFAIPQPEGASFRFGIFGGSPAPAAISPDGKLVVFGADAGGKRLLWVRPLNAFEARPLEGTQGAQYPFWSPDSRWVGFFADGKLKKIEASGQTPTETLCDAPDGRGGTWNREGVIIFQPTSTGTSLQQVSENGGTPAAVGPPVTEKNLSLRWPFFLPDGKHFLFTIGSPSLQKKQTGGGIFVGSLDSQESRRILEDDSNAVYVPSGHLLFVRDQVLMAIEFDAPTLKTRGGVRPLAESVQYEPLRWMGHFSASQTGTLLFWKGTASPARQLAWFDRSGKELGKFGEPDNYLGIRLSPGGKQVAAVIGGSAKQNIDIWLLDLERGGRTRFTFSPAADVAPVWSPDQKAIVYSSQELGAFDLYLKAANGAASEQLLFQSGEGKLATDWSADGQTILFTAGSLHAETWAYSLADHKAAPVLSGDFNYLSSVFSPDGKWIAYQSNESGRPEVYVRPFPSLSGKWQISPSGGVLPHWRRDGKELIYLEASHRQLMAVDIVTTPAFGAGIPKPVFSGVMVEPVGSNVLGLGGALTPDHQRLLLAKSPTTTGQPAPPISVVVNWTAELKK